MSYSQKILLGAFAVILLALVIESTSRTYNEFSGSYAKKSYAKKNHSLILGSRKPFDRLMVNQKVFAAARRNSVVTVTKNYTIPIRNFITQVKALDGRRDGSGAFVYKLKGGPGFRNVSLRFKSQIGKPVNFTVVIYGK